MELRGEVLDPCCLRLMQENVGRPRGSQSLYGGAGKLIKKKFDVKSEVLSGGEPNESNQESKAVYKRLPIQRFY
jgi:hypothetical protein